MAATYDKYYNTENLFGEPYPELIDFFTNYPARGKVLDLGCGQGRDAIPIARLGFEVSGIDNSKVGIDQMMKIGHSENLNLKGEVANMYEFHNFQNFDFVLFDSLFHFHKKDRDKETKLIKTAIENVSSGCVMVFCIQEIGNKVKILNQTVDFKRKLERLTDLSFKFKWKQKESSHESITNYRMIIVKKQENFS